MSKNILPDIAKLFGVEINEEFKIYNTKTGDVSKNIVCILENKIVGRKQDDLLNIWYTLDAEDLNKIFNGEYTVVRKPYTPKTDEKYWSYQGDQWNVVDYIWMGLPADYALLGAGMIFRTKEEALQNRPRVYSKATGKRRNSKVDENDWFTTVSAGSC